MRTTLAISEIISEWIASTDVKLVTAKSYKERINLWFRFLAKRGNQRSASVQDVMEYKRKMQEEQLSSFTINGNLIVVKLFYKWCDKKGYCANIAQDVKTNFRVTAQNKVPLTLEQSKELLLHVSGDGILERRNKVIIALMLFNGLRCCEIERANINDISEREGKKILYIQRKGRDDKNEFIPLQDEVLDYLSKYLELRGQFEENEPMFVSHRKRDERQIIRLSRHQIGLMVKKKMREIGINDKKLTAHSLRHTFGSLLVEQGVDIEDIRLLMGHCSTAVTRLYVEMVQQRKMLHNSPAKKIIQEILK